MWDAEKDGLGWESEDAADMVCVPPFIYLQSVTMKYRHLILRGKGYIPIYFSLYVTMLDF